MPSATLPARRCGKTAALSAQMRADMRMYGIAAYRSNPDGSCERIDPRQLFVEPDDA